MTYRSLRTSTGSELAVLFHGDRRPGGIPIVLCHGYIATADQWYDAASGAPLVPTRVADQHGLTCVGAADGGTAPWGNAAAMTSIDNLVTWAAANHGTKTDEVALYGGSHGAMTALNWAMRNEGKVAALVLTIPAVSLQGLHDRDPAGLGIAASIEAAYTNQAGYLAALPTRDPSHANNLPVTKRLADRTRIWYSSNDNVVAAAEVTSYAGATGTPATNMGAQGHALPSSYVPEVVTTLGLMVRAAG